MTAAAILVGALVVWRAIVALTEVVQLGVDLLSELRSEQRRCRIVLEEFFDIYRAADRVTDPLGEIPPGPVRPGSGEETPRARPRRRC